MNRRTLAILVPVIFVAGAVVLAASSFNFNLVPVVMDQGGEGASSSRYQQYGSVGGPALGGTSGSPNYANSSSFIPGLFPGSPSPPDSFLIAAGGANPPDTNENTGATAVPMLQVSLTAGPGRDIEVQSLAVTASGTGDDQNHVSGIDLYLDVNGDGAPDGGDVLMAFHAGGFSADDGTVSFSGLARRIDAGTTQNWLVTCNFSGGAPAGATFRTRIANNGDVTAVDASTLAPVMPFGAPVPGGTKTVAGPLTPGSLRLFTPGRDPNAVAPLPGEKSVAIFPFGIGASSVEDVTISKLRFTGTGTGDDRLGVEAVRLFRDADGNGKLDPGDVEIGVSGYPADDSAVEFSGLGETVGAGGTLRLLLVYDLSASVLAGHSFAALISKSGDVEATGDVSSQAILPSGTPVGAMVTVRPAPSWPPEGAEGCGCLPAAGGGAGGHLPAFLLLFLSLLFLRSRAAYCFLRRTHRKPIVRAAPKGTKKPLAVVLK